MKEVPALTMGQNPWRRNMADAAILNGCTDCKAIFDRPVYRYLDGGVQEEFDFCPSCGGASATLGPEPAVTEPDAGQFFLTDGENMMGPYPSKEDAQLDLWAWFGGKPDAAKSIQGDEDTKEDEEDDDQIG